jgi:GNAT superfamily N-acetyltransferase
MAIRIRELTHTEIPLIFPLLREHNPWMTRPVFSRFLKPMLADGYRVVGAFDGAELIGCAGFWVRTRFWCGKQLDIDNFIVTEATRGTGLGAKLSDWLEKRAKAEQCDLIVLDTYVTSHGAHQFYGKQGFAITGYHMTKMPGSEKAGALPFAKQKAIRKVVKK